jgi:thiol-disulfide isomerase/thioredoxin
MKPIVLFFLLFSFWFSSCKTKIKSEVPVFAAKQYKGDTVNLIDLTKNKVTIIFFWTTFCDNCLTEISNIHFLYTKYKDNKKFSFITVAYNTEEEIKQFNAIRDTTNPYQQYISYLKLDSFDIPILIGANKGYKIYNQDDGSFIPGIRDTMEVSKLYNLFNFQGLPTTLIYNANGEIIYKYSGPRTMRGNLDEYKLFLGNKIDSLLNN